MKGPLGFGHTSRLHKPHYFATDERPVVIEICDAEGKINAFLPVLDEMMESGLVTLVTLKRARVLQYGRKRSGYFKRLKQSVLQHLHIHERSQRGESDSKPGHAIESSPVQRAAESP